MKSVYWFPKALYTTKRISIEKLAKCSYTVYITQKALTHILFRHFHSDPISQTMIQGLLLLEAC